MVADVHCVGCSFYSAWLASYPGMKPVAASVEDPFRETCRVRNRLDIVVISDNDGCRPASRRVFLPLSLAIFAMVAASPRWSSPLPQSGT